MAIYIDNGKTVKTYLVSKKIEKVIQTLVESDGELVWRLQKVRNKL